MTDLKERERERKKNNKIKLKDFNLFLNALNARGRTFFK